MSGRGLVELGAVADITREVVQPEALDPDVMYIGLENIERGGALVKLGTVRDAGVESAKFRFTKEHVLYGKLRPNLAKIGRPEFDGVCSTDILPIRPRAALRRDYLAHFLLQPRIISLAASRATGANLPRLSPSELMKFQLPLVPIEEQQRVVEMLDRADGLRAKRREALAQFDSLTRSVFVEMFGHPMLNEGIWPREQIGHIAKVIRGASPRPAGDPRYFGGPIPWLKISDITASQGRYVNEIKEGVTLAGRDRSVFVRAGTLVLTNSATVGIPKILGKASCIHDGFIAFLDLDEDLSLGYLWAHLALMRKHFSQLAPEGTQKNLNTSLVKSVKVLVPPIQLQRSFERRLEVVERLKETYRASLVEMDALFASLRDRAFRGEL